MKPVKWLLQGDLTVEIKGDCVWISNGNVQILLDENDDDAPSLHDVIDALMAANNTLGYDVPSSVIEF